ncbi:hypothetical protein [Dickeya fangzhongdai]|uniref:hypothetical protein n=1 Tax=Dickeya fangzhongdai TaxID=1778540 RepID=UPI002B261A0A|nr:hypothetical protein [Dickeya fangzhongdai]WOX99985.1 hypothetical protein OGM22_20680 [Dickeya fangzhongdai]WOY04866.1 hypothetical protein OGM21_01745 [Dickeya fangzhongdai]
MIAESPALRRAIPQEQRKSAGATKKCRSGRIKPSPIHKMASLNYLYFIDIYFLFNGEK